MKENLSGVVLVNKHKGVTSHDIVNKMRRIYGTRQVGHTGTLDPMATGVLAVLVGRAVKASEYLLSENKTYRAVMRLGITTDTEDTSGNILTEADKIPDEKEVLTACESFRGKIEQIPPMYSALKVGGKKLVDLARKGETVEREARECEIFSLETKKLTETDYELVACVSKGTYIRTLCADIGKKLGCGAAMAELERRASGHFRIEDALDIASLEALSDEEKEKRVIPVESLFTELPKVELNEFYSKLAASGCEIYQKKINTNYALHERVRMYNSNGFFALGEVMEFEGGSAIKAIKMFVI